MTPGQRVPDPPPADSLIGLMRRLVAQLDESGGILLELSSGTYSSVLSQSILDENHKVLTEARKWLMATKGEHNVPTE